jgi:hypothetical protein
MKCIMQAGCYVTHVKGRGWAKVAWGRLQVAEAAAACCVCKSDALALLLFECFQLCDMRAAAAAEPLKQTNATTSSQSSGWRCEDLQAGTSATAAAAIGVAPLPRSSLHQLASGVLLIILHSV